MGRKEGKEKKKEKARERDEREGKGEKEEKREIKDVDIFWFKILSIFLVSLRFLDLAHTNAGF